MSKAAVVYWSGTGHTEAMANAVANGCGGELFTAADFDADKAAGFDAFALGCPAMGSEELEDSEFQPMYDAVKGALAGKKVVLFGSYDWGDGEWLRTWEDDAKDSGLNVLGTLAVNNEPDDDALSDCEKLGALLK